MSLLDTAAYAQHFVAFLDGSSTSSVQAVGRQDQCQTPSEFVVQISACREVIQLIQSQTVGEVRFSSCA